jgi:PAS domain S-box-containing protein
LTWSIFDRRQQAAFLLIRKTLREADLSNALGESKSLYQVTIDSMMDAIVVIDSRQNIVLFNPAAEKMFGRSAQSMLGSPLSVLIPTHLRKDHSRHVAQFQQSATPSRAMAPLLSITGLHANGTLFPIESTISQTMVRGEAQLTAVLRDITERQLAERELKEMNDELALLLVQREDIRENERTRISLELHDDLGQRLTGLKLDVAWLSNRIKDGRIPEQDKIDALRAQIDQAISSVRRISTELRPMVFDELDFDAAVAWQVQEFSQRTGVEVGLSLEEVSETKNEAVALGLFRIVQESLTNIARHARATRVDIALRKSNQVLVLCIRDNGQGMAIDSIRKGLGVIGMRERAKTLGAQFTFSSEVEKGTSIKIELPLDAAVFSKVAT